MESDDENFAKQGGEALEIGEEFDSEEENGEQDDNQMDAEKDEMRQPLKGKMGSGAGEDGAEKAGGKEEAVKG